MGWESSPIGFSQNLATVQRRNELQNIDFNDVASKNQVNLI